MIITRCGSCGKLLHETGKCFFCGNTTNFVKVSSTTDIHSNIKEEYEKLEILVKNKKFDAAIALSKNILEWMPNCSDVFWLRLLSKNNCNTDEELVRKGVFCEESSDYYNAVFFGNEAQKEVYKSISEKISLLKDVLLRHVTEHEYVEKKRTNILQIQTDFPNEINYRTRCLHELMDELVQTECEIATIEKDCLLLVDEHRMTLEKITSEADSIKSKTHKIEECNEEELHKYQTKFGELHHQLEQAKVAITSMRKQHPWITEYNDLTKKRDGIVTKIDNELNSLKSYQKHIKSTVAEIERIETRHTEALISLTKYRFFDICDLLGEDQFTSAFHEAGIM